MLRRCTASLSEPLHKGALDKRLEFVRRGSQEDTRGQSARQIPPLRNANVEVEIGFAPFDNATIDPRQDKGPRLPKRTGKIV